MKGTRFLGVVAAAASAALSAGPVAARVVLEPPPGWADVSSTVRIKGVLLVLRGPGASSLTVARAPVSVLLSAAATRAYLIHALDGERGGARLDYRSTGRVETRLFRNGVTAHFLRATLDGRQGLIIAVLDAGGPPLSATLASAAPDAMMTPLFGAMQWGDPERVHESGLARSVDGQLEIALGGGLRSRDLSGAERRQGAVLAVQGSGSEVMFIKLDKEEASPRGRSALVRTAVADGAKVALADVSPAYRATTAAGPAAVYAWAKVSSAADLRFAVGFLPWQYWGYALRAQGPQADELLVGALAALEQGPSAVAGLVAATPVVEIASPLGWRQIAVAVMGLLLLSLWGLSRTGRT